MELTLPITGHVYAIDDDQCALGEGTYSRVYPARRISSSSSSSEPERVAKFTPLRTTSFYHTWIAENAVFDVLDKLPPHPHIIQRVGKTTCDGYGILILEKFAGITLDDYINIHGSLSEADSVHVLKQIVSALKFLHANKIVFNDLKLENIGYDHQTRRVKLFDFGLSRITRNHHDIVDDSKGTPMTMSPEKFHVTYHNPYWSELWSLGQVAYHMGVGSFMFWSCHTMDDLKDEMIRCRDGDAVKASVRSTHKLSRSALGRMILALCAYDPKMRWTAEQTETWLFRTYPDPCSLREAKEGEELVLPMSS
jgi:serine/threonine protein kinase